MNKLNLLKQKLLQRPLALVLAIAVVVAAIPGALLIYAFNSAKTEDKPFTENVVSELTNTPAQTFLASDIQTKLDLEGGWEVDGTALVTTADSSRVTIAFSGVGIALQTSRTDRMTVSVDGSLPAVVTASDAQYYVATQLDDSVLHTVTVSFAGIGSKLMAVGLYADPISGCKLENAHDVEYYTQSLDGFETLDNWTFKANAVDLNTNEFKEGEASLKAVTSASKPTLTAIYGKNVPLNKDVKGLQFALKVEDASDILSLTVQLANNAATSETGYLWQYSGDQLMNGWNTVSLPFAGATDKRSTSPDMVYDHFVIYITATDGTALFLDDVRFFYSCGIVRENILLDAESDYDNDVMLLYAERSNQYKNTGSYSYKMTEPANLQGEPTAYTHEVDMSLDLDNTEFYVYVYFPAGQLDNLGSLHVELTSSGGHDQEEYEWVLTPAILKEQGVQEDKWCKVALDYSAVKKSATELRPSAINFIRVYSMSNVAGSVFYLDDLTVKGNSQAAVVYNNIGYRNEVKITADETFNYLWRTQNQSSDSSDKVVGIADPTGNGRGKVFDMSLKGVAAGTTSGYCATELYCAPHGILLDVYDTSRMFVELDIYVTAEAIAKKAELHLELGANGVMDTQEYEFVKGLSTLSEGWNTVRFSGANVKEINTMRIFIIVKPALATGASLPVYIDNLKFISGDARNNVSVKEQNGATAKLVTKANNFNASNPNTMLYDTVDTVVAAFNVLDFGADPTGYADSTKAINMAIKACSRLGGGTVWMPAGTYLVTDSITVYSLVTLRGDYQDPDKGTNYGTVIWAKPESSNATNTGLFILSGSAGVEGLTIYYPEQDISNVKPYPYTFFLPNNYTELASHEQGNSDYYMGLDPDSHMLRTIKNVTLINAYRGLAVTRNEMTMVKNLKGTVLKTGLKLGDTSDVGTVDGITLKPEYWANAAYAMRTATRVQIVNWCKGHQTAGMQIGSIEQQQFTDVTLQGYTYGMLFPSKSDRFMGSGPMYNINISDCTYGLYAEGGTYLSTSAYASDKFPLLTGVDWRCGYNITGGSISGDKFAIYNASTPIRPESGYVRDIDGNRQEYYKRVYSADGTYKDEYVSGSGDFNWHVGSFTLAGVTVNGNVYDFSATRAASDGTPVSVYYSRTGTYVPDGLAAPATPADRTVKSTGSYFTVITEGATEAQIQAALTAAGNAGGGTVYLTAGRYTITSGLSVPANVELKGAAGISQRIASRGTTFDVDQATVSQGLAPTATPAAVTLNGNNAGVSGIFFLYDENIRAIDSNGAFNFYPYTIRGNNSGNWVVDCAIAGASHGINLTGADFVIENAVTAATRQDITVNGNNGIIRNCLHNGNLLFRTGLKNEMPVSEGGDRDGNGVSDSFDHYFQGGVKSTTYLNYITVAGGNNIYLINNFVYGSNTVLVNRGSNTIAINFGTDANGGTHFSADDGCLLTVYNPVITSASKMVDGPVRGYNISKVNSREKDINP